MSEQYSQLNSTDESLFVAGTFILNSIGFTLALIILFSLCYRQDKNRQENSNAFTFAVISVICSLGTACTAVVFGNDLLFHWEYDGKHQSFVSMTESFFMIFYAVGKIAFYCSFTYHVLCVFDPNHSTRKYLTVWMGIACFFLFCLMIGYLIDDISEESIKEIGVTSLHHIYLTMLSSHEGAVYTHYFTFGAVAVDMLYFIVLLFCYSKQLRRIALNDNPENIHDVKGVVLIFVSCVTFWIILCFLGSGSSLAWFAPMDVMSDDICLFLMFEPQSEIYHFWCKSCDRCCFRCIYGSKGYGAISDVDEAGHDAPDHSESLL